MINKIKELFGYIPDKNQEQKILNLLRSNKWKWVPVNRFMRLWIAQYNARIFWLRKKWYQIFNKTKLVSENWKKIKHSFYMLITENDNT